MNDATGGSGTSGRGETAGRALGRFAKAARSKAAEYGPRGEELARKSADAAKRGIEAARPEAERLAREAKPLVERAGRETMAFAQRHERELTEAGKAIARTAGPRPLKIIISAIDRTK